MLKFFLKFIRNFNIYNILIIRVSKKSTTFQHPNRDIFYLYKTLTNKLLSSTEVEFGKNLIRTWVEFGKKMVPGKQGVERGQNRAKNSSKMLKFNIIC